MKIFAAMRSLLIVKRLWRAIARLLSFSSISQRLSTNLFIEAIKD